MSLSIKRDQGTPLTVSVRNKLFLSLENCSKSSHDKLVQPIFLSSSVTVSISSSFLVHLLFTKKILVSFGYFVYNLKHMAFLIIPPKNVFKSFLFCFTFDLVITPPDFFFASRYFSLLVFPCFHFVRSFSFSLALTNIIIPCLAGAFSQPQFLSVALRKLLLKRSNKRQQKPLFDYLLCTYCCMT